MGGFRGVLVRPGGGRAVHIIALCVVVIAVFVVQAKVDAREQGY